MGSPIEYLGNRAETLLSSRIPYLQLEYFILDPDEIGTKFYPYCHIMIIFEIVLHEALQDAGLAYTGVADDDDFEEGVVVGEGLVSDYFVLQVGDAF